MDVLVLIDKLDDLIHNAKPVPLTDQVRVDKEEIYDILDQMRATIPEEIKQARWIVKERQEMLAEAKREAERIIKEAREKQDQLISQEEVTRSGRARRRGHHRGRPRTRARDPARRGGLRRRDPRHARGQPHEVHRRRAAVAATASPVATTKRTTRPRPSPTAHRRPKRRRWISTGLLAPRIGVVPRDSQSKCSAVARATALEATSSSPPATASRRAARLTERPK